MKKLSLKFDLEGLNFNGEDDKKNAVELSTSTIKNLILHFGAQKQGLVDDERRKFYKICDAFEKALKENATEVELEDDWFGFIKKSFREVKYIPSDLSRRVENLIDQVPDR